MRGQIPKHLDYRYDVNTANAEQWAIRTGDFDGTENEYGGVRRTPSGHVVMRLTTGWHIQLTDPTEIDLFGTEWIPLPLTALASYETVVAHCARMRA